MQTKASLKGNPTPGGFSSSERHDKRNLTPAVHNCPFSLPGLESTIYIRNASEREALSFLPRAFQLTSLHRHLPFHAHTPTPPAIASRGELCPTSLERESAVSLCKWTRAQGKRWPRAAGGLPGRDEQPASTVCCLHKCKKRQQQRRRGTAPGSHPAIGSA